MPSVIYCGDICVVEFKLRKVRGLRVSSAPSKVRGLRVSSAPSNDSEVVSLLVVGRREGEGSASSLRHLSKILGGITSVSSYGVCWPPHARLVEYPEP